MSRLPDVMTRTQSGGSFPLFPRRRTRKALAGLCGLGVVAGLGACLDRPVAPASPFTNNTFAEQVRVTAVDKIDLLFAIDNSSSMADKQQVLKDAVPDLLGRLISPNCVDDKNNPVVKGADGACPAGAAFEFNPIADIHIGIVSSSLGGHGSSVCSSGDTNTKHGDDQGHLISGSRAGTNTATYANQGFLAWDPGSGTPKTFKNSPPGQGDATALTKDLSDLVVGVGQDGCGYESQLEGWYRFLVDPSPPAKIDVASSNVAAPAITGIDQTVLQQRADFLRPDSLVAVIVLSDENDVSIIDGPYPAGVRDAQGTIAFWPDNYLVNKQDGSIKSGPFNGNGNQIAIYQQNPTALFGALFAGTPACAQNPFSPDCQPCLDASPENQAKGCSPSQIPLAKGQDGVNIRGWDQRRRYGFDTLYPLQRYIDGLRNLTIYDTSGAVRSDNTDPLYKDPNGVPVAPLVANPLFDDLQYKKKGTTKAPPRDPNLVFFVGIVGVPWQDIAKDQKNFDLGNPDSKVGGFRSTTGSKEEAVDWDLILGDPFNPSGPVRPRDPLMVESQTDRTKLTPPLANLQLINGKTLSATGWNDINGHEWSADQTTNGDLQYACVFPLAEDEPSFNPASPRDGCVNSDTRTASDLASAATLRNPLCEGYTGDPSKKTGNGDFSKGIGARAKGYPGPRFLHIIKQLGPSGVVASICPKNLVKKTNPDGTPTLDYGYRPAVSAIIDRLKTQLNGRCLPRKLAPNPDNTTPCLIIDARLPKNVDGTSSATPEQIQQCGQCNSKAHKPLDPEIRAVLTGDVTKYECLCEVTQLTGDDSKTCQTDAKKQELLPTINGWCYVDPSTTQDPTLKQGASDIVKACPANEQRTLRFLNTETDNTTLFITCLGAASGTEQVVSSDGTAGASSTGSAGSSSTTSSAGAGGSN